MCAGIRTLGWRYGQSAVVGTVATPQHATAWQRFLPSGPLALLPSRGEGYSGVVWTTTPARAQALAACSDDAFAAAVDAALQGDADSEDARVADPDALGSAIAAAARVLGGALAAPPPPWLPPPRVSAAPGARRAAFPLGFSHAARYSAPRLALLGDAAHAVHPLAGQGLNLGIADAVALARCLADGVAAGRDLGEGALLEAYGRSAAAANAPMLAALDALQRLFGAHSPAVAALRSAGLGAVNALPGVRRAIIRYAVGDDAPRDGQHTQHV